MSHAGDFGFDPLGLGVDPEQLKWFREAELQHSRWAMAAVAGILVQEVAKPETFWYSAASTVELPFPIIGIVAFQILTMQWVELRRWQVRSLCMQWAYSGEHVTLQIL